MIDLTAIVNDLAFRIASIPNIGLVWAHDLFDRDDLSKRIVSEIGGQRTLRAWWVSGPEMASEPQGYGADSQRTWTFTIHGIEGLAPAGVDIVTLRANGAAVTEALDADVVYAEGLAQADPCTWPVIPEHRTFAGGVGISYLQIQKRLTTF